MRTTERGARARRARTALGVAIALGAALMLAACAAGPNTAAGTPGPDGDVAGFWLGLWHGLIAVVTFVISLFTDSVSVYEVHNDGGWYDFGFVLGLLLSLGSGGGGAAARRRR